MPQITISVETHTRLMAFQPVSQQLMDKELAVGELADVLIGVGIDATLLTFWQDSEAALATLRKLGVRHPQEVYQLVADALKAGTEAEQEEARQRLPFGFRPQG